jgi:hypothetical protein
MRCLAGRVAGAAGLLLAARALPGQVSVTGSTFAGVAQHSVDAGYGIEHASGPILGGAASVYLFDRMELALEALGGSLNGESAGVLDQDAGQIAARLRVRTVRWLAVEAGYVRRVYSTALARQTWTMVATGVEARVAILDGAVHGVARIDLLPSVSVNGLPKPDLAFTSAAGLDYHYGPVTAGVLYSLERCDFPVVSSTQRLEQLTALSLRLAWRL